eukprot:CAMPEP_0197020398 /NCGR_PEP_ID=MMETSP1384-20130603/1158_1 /TAXON_ID=29189 /ORGANISM="Ammonia sp." /LENGTH=524 /DNA_ID=CAMNT_0042448009 /DNA_START=38 /DNA_END=1612 /DNA_ORIENTATION=+
MADSFFSSFTAACRFDRDKKRSVHDSNTEQGTTKSSSFNHKQRLMKQATDSYAFSKQLEANLHRKEEHHSRRCKQFMHQIAKFKKLNKELTAALQIKDKLLREKSHALIQKTSEIIQLKEEVQELKLQLLFKQTLITTLNRNASSHSNLTRITQETSLSASDDEHGAQNASSSASSPSSSSCSPCHKNAAQFVPRTKCDLPTKSLPNIEQSSTVTNSKETDEDKHTQNVSVCNYDSVLAKYLMVSHSEHDLLHGDQLPFIHRKSSTQTSSLSACAVKISFPSPTVAMPNESNMIGAPPLQLSPISESKARDEFNKKGPSSTSPPQTPNSPIPLLKTSDDNKHIDEEWGQSIAGEETHSVHTLKTEESDRSPVPNDVADEEQEAMRMPSIEDAFEFVQDYENSDEMLATLNDDNISYCTDNTYDMMEMMMEVDNACMHVDGHEHGSQENSPTDMKHNAVSKVSSGHFSKQSHGNISRSDIDGVIRAPINIFALNTSFFQFQLQGPPSSHNRNNATIIKRNLADEK